MVECDTFWIVMFLVLPVLYFLAALMMGLFMKVVYEHIILFTSSWLIDFLCLGKEGYPTHRFMHLELTNTWKILKLRVNNNLFNNCV